MMARNGAKIVGLGLVLSLAWATPPVDAAPKTIKLEGRFGEIVSDAVSKPGLPGDVELGQEVRTDHLTSADPDWDGATATLYEQNLSFPERGSFRSFGLITLRSGDRAYLELEGKWNVVPKGQTAEMPFEGQGKIVGGSGKLEGMGGTVNVTGAVKPNEGGRYSVTITVPQ